mgnify:CR=1 FL=1
MYTVKFRATQRDLRTDRIMKAAAGVENVGFAVVISFNTEQEPTLKYLNKIAKEIENLPPVNFKYFSNVRPVTRGFY